MTSRQKLKMKTLFVLLIISVFAMHESVTAHYCGRGWASFEKNCYYFSNSAVNFTDAMIACYNLGSSLLEIRNSREEKWIDLQYRLRGFTYRVWLGFCDVQKEGHMVSISDLKRPSYANWVRGEPNNQDGHEDCVVYGTTYRGWNDISCSTKISFVCTKK